MIKVAGYLLDDHRSVPGWCSAVRPSPALCTDLPISHTTYNSRRSGCRVKHLCGAEWLANQAVIVCSFACLCMIYVSCSYYIHASRLQRVCKCLEIQRFTYIIGRRWNLGFDVIDRECSCGPLPCSACGTGQIDSPELWEAQCCYYMDSNVQEREWIDSRQLYDSLVCCCYSR